MNFKFQGFIEQSVFILTNSSEGNFTSSLNKDNYNRFNILLLYFELFKKINLFNKLFQYRYIIW